MRLIIVESPTKAKTISKFLDKKYSVRSSYGHIRDLPKSEMGIDIENDFEPRYIIPSKVRLKVAELKKLSEKSEEVILATDEDREGEAIAWHLSQVLEKKVDKKSKPQTKSDEQIPKLKIKSQNSFKRIVFHEITKKAIEKALENPRTIDLNLVDAQQARRVLDRLVGYELSPFLWKKIRPGLSAGRVQSVALRLVVEREREIQNFQKQEYWTINVRLKKNSDIASEFEAGLTESNGEKVEQSLTLKLFAGDYKTKKTIIENQRAADKIISALEKSDYQVLEVVEKETQRFPSAPFTTSTLQQAAIGNLGYSAKQTMAIAQKLYEQGYITYMRTDSVNLSLESMLTAGKYIEKKFGKNYALESPRFFKTKSKGAQEAHEAIRPAYPEKAPAEVQGELELSQYRLYGLIWNRMIASQMQPAIFDSVRADIQAENKSAKSNYLFRANGSTLKFDGFLKVYGEKNSSAETENMLPKLKKDDILNLVNAISEQKSTTPPPRYNEASLVKVLEENGIGRPSTYAPIISTIMERKYVDRNEEKRLFPLKIGTVVNDLLVANFPEIVDIKFTATIEEDFDRIAEGRINWIPVIREFYEPFHQQLEAKEKEVKKEDIHEKLDKKCPDCGGDLIVRFGRFGKFIACSNFPNCKFTEKTAEEKKIDEENSGEVCNKCGAPMVVKHGRFGAFLGCSKYPECKNIKGIENKLGIKCPKCGKGDVVERRSKKGRSFFGCSRYPECDFVMWNKPTGKICEKCGALMTFGAKGKQKCSSKECGFEK